MMKLLERLKNNKQPLKLNKTSVRQILRILEFDPKKPGSLKIILDSGNNTYYKFRAIEIINEAAINQNIENLDLAIQLLILSILFDLENTFEPV